MLLTLFGISVVIFVLLRLVPGNIADILYDAAGMINPAEKAELEHELGLDRSIPVQYAHWMGGLLHGDLGYSYRLGEAGDRGDPAAHSDHRQARRPRAGLLRALSACRSASSARSSRTPGSTISCACSASPASRCPPSGWAF